MDHLAKKQMNNDTIYVACACDKNFALSLTTMLKSLLLNFKNDRKIVIYILTDNPKYFLRNKIIRSLQTNLAEIKPVYISNKQFKNMKVSSGQITLAAYYRLLTPMVLPEGCTKAIYLDADLIVNTDIGRLWDLDIEENHILAAQEQGMNALYLSSPDGLLMHKELGLDPKAKQFNSGVMLINLIKWRKDNISQKVIGFLEQNKEKIRWWDQDGLNAILAGKWGELDLRWNLLTQIFSNPSWENGPMDDIKKYNKLINHPHIVHFNTASKPWHKDNIHPYKYLYFSYLTLPIPKKPLPLYGINKIFRSLRQLNSKTSSFNYYYKIYRKKILKSKPMLCDINSEYEVHIVTSHKDYLDAIWCLKTFYYYSGSRPNLVIHDDGTLTEDHIDIFLHHFVNCRAIKRENADEDLNRLLINYKYCNKYRSKKDFFCALKLFDIIYYAKTNKLLLLDSDILFFKKPDEILKYIKDGKPFFNSDYQNAYSKPVKDLNKMFDMDILPMFNAGLMFMTKEQYINDLPFIEDYFKKMDENDPIIDINRHEQTINALLLSKYDAIRLNENYQISQRSIAPGETISHHFVDDGSRTNFYIKGLKYLKNNKFLEQINSSSYL